MLQRLKVESGGEVLVAMRDLAAPEIDIEIVEEAAESLEDVFRNTRPIINGIVQGLGNLDLDEVSLTCSASITKGGKILFLGNAEVEGGIELTLTWKPRDVKPAQPGG